MNLDSFLWVNFVVSIPAVACMIAGVWGLVNARQAHARIDHVQTMRAVAGPMGATGRVGMAGTQGRPGQDGKDGEPGVCKCASAKGASAPAAPKKRGRPRKAAKKTAK